MRWRMACLSGLATAAMLASFAAGLAGEPQRSRPPSAPAKLRQAEAIAREAESRNIHGPYTIPQIRRPTPRDSGRDGMLLFLRNVNFRFVAGIGFFGLDVIARVRAKDGVSPVIFDDPQSFSLEVMAGDLVVSGAALTELLNTHVFNFPGAPVRKLAVATQPGALTLAGEMNRRGKWAPFAMTGGLALEGASTLLFTPSEITIDGVSATPLLKAANVNLDELITLQAPGVRLDGSVIRLETAALFPPPVMSFTVKAAAVEARGLALSMTSPLVPAWPAPPLARDSYALIRGGDVKFLTVMTVNTLMQIVAEDGGPLDFSLYDYRPQLARGSFRFQPNGGLIVSLAKAAPAGAAR
jgi:hypothetical protein